MRLDRVEDALAKNHLSGEVFERCAQDLLSKVFPGLTPIPGGSDWGRDGDISGTADAVPPRLLASSSRGLAGARKNMLAGIKSMKEHGVPFGRLVLANPGSLSRSDRGKLAASASRAGASLAVNDIYDRTFFASQLRRDAYWREALLGLPSSPDTLLPTAPGIAESPWASLPFTARDDDLAAVAEQGDLILPGRPGVGKSRLLSQLPDVAFVEKSASLESIAADLRWAKPPLVVVDDAVGAELLLRRLIWMRQSEPATFAYRLIAVCWPPDTDALRAMMPEARVHELELMEREPLDALVQAMGITGRLARREILDQAQGRPGWAITLGDLLLRKHDPQRVISGKALHGEVTRYLHRTGLADAIDLLATISALGGITDAEIGQMSTGLQVPRRRAALLLGSAAQSGLIDVTTRPADGARFYAVRPPLLADALVAEQAFSVPVPALDLRGLAEQWPGHAAEIARTAIAAAVYEAPGARGVARDMLDAALGNPAIPSPTKASLCLDFARLNYDEAQYVTRAARLAFDQLALGNDAALDTAGITAVAGRAAQLHQLDSAVDLLFDLALAASPSGRRRRDDPLGQLGQLVSEFHPEVPRRTRVRLQIARRARLWLSQGPAEPARMHVAAAAARLVLSLGIRSSLQNPGRLTELHIIETIVPAEEIRHIREEVWPELEPLLDSRRPALAVAAIDTAEEWLRIGGGYDRPFGGEHAPDRVHAAKQAGEALARELAGRGDLSPGLLARLRSAVTRLDADIEIRLTPDVAVYFSDIRGSGGQWQDAQRALTEAIHAAADARACDEPDDVVAFLADVKTELSHLPRSWPNRPGIAAARIAAVTDDPLPWLQAAVRRSFLPEGCVFAERLAREGRLSVSDAGTLLRAPASRDETIEMLLRGEAPANTVTSMAADDLGADDYRLLSKLTARNALSPERFGALLSRPDRSFAALVAAAMFDGQVDKEGWSPGELEQAWLSALPALRPARIPGCSGQDMAELFEYLAARHPAALTDIITNTLDEATGDYPFACLPFECWAAIRKLTDATKLQLWRRFRNRPEIRKLLLRQLAAGTQLIAQLLDADEITPDEALACYDGNHVEVPVEELAPLLVPRGISPARIAHVKFYGYHSGNLSSWYQSTVDAYTAMLGHDDPDVKAVAAAGVASFTQWRDDAVRREREQRIRGTYG
jgi:hypothetical protein